MRSKKIINKVCVEVWDCWKDFNSVLSQNIETDAEDFITDAVLGILENNPLEAKIIKAELIKEGCSASETSSILIDRIHCFIQKRLAEEKGKNDSKKGAGRPRKGKEATKQYCIRLQPSVWQKIIDEHGGLQKGIDKEFSPKYEEEDDEGAYGPV